jgi:hypothetical protein
LARPAFEHHILFNTFEDHAIAGGAGQVDNHLSNPSILRPAGAMARNRLNSSTAGMFPTL